MSASVSPASCSPCTSRKWSTTPGSAATVLPLRSATLLTEPSQMILSLPVELSFTTTMTCSEPPATLAMVSFRVWVTPSSWPLAMASIDAR